MIFKNKNNIKSEWLASFPEMNPNPILEIDSKGHLTYVNSAAKKIFPGIEEMRIKHPFVLELDLYFGKLHGLAQKYIEREVEANGCWYLQTIALVDSNHLRVYSSDITEHKLAENALRESENKFRAMVEYSNDMIWTLDIKGNFLFFNKRAEEIIGYVLKDWVGKSFAPLIQKEDFPRLVEIFKKTLSGESTQYEVSITGKNNQLVTLLVNTAPLFSKGEIIGTISFGKDITEYKRVEYELKKSEKKYKDLVENSAVGVYSTNLKGEILYVNEAAYKIFEFDSAADMIASKAITRYKNPQDRQILLERLKNEGKVTNFEFQAVTNKGTEKTILLSAALSNDILTGMIQDITEKKKTEEVLKESEDKFRTIIETAHDIIWMLDLQGNVTYLNQQGEEILKNYKMPNVVGKGYSFKVVEEDLPKVQEAVAQTFQGKPQSFEARIYLSDNTILFLSVNQVPLYRGGNVIGAVCFGRDITKSKKAEEALKRERDLTVQEKNKINAILYSIGDGVFVIDQNYKIIIFNDIAAEISGYAVKEAIGKRYDEVLKFIFEQSGEINNKFIVNAMNTGVIQTIQNHTLLIRKGGERVPVADSAAPLKDKNNNVIGCVVVFRDVTKDRQVDKAKTEFVSLASHQLRTPLAAIAWHAEMLLTGSTKNLTKKQLSYLNEVYDSNKRMINLVNALLNMSRIDLGTFAVEPEPVNFAQISRDVLKELSSQIRKKKIKIKEDYDKKVPIINVDPKLMRIVFQNLLSNAVKYTPNRGKVSVAIVKQKNNILITVSDTGFGIPGAQQDKIFSKLFRADNAKSKDPDGSGLGLYITKAIVEASGGKIWFESVENKGSIFYVTLPLRGAKIRKGNKGLIFSR